MPQAFKMNTWRWIGNRQNMTRYTNWNGGTVGVGCAPACLSMFGMTITAPKWKWKAQNKGTPYPYICVSDCAVGYIWQREARKCVKIVRSLNAQLKHSDAAVTCAKDQGRLLSLETCDQFVGLQNDLWTQFPNLADRYWLGYYAQGFGRYTTGQRLSPVEATMMGAAGRKSVLPGGTVNDCLGDKRWKVVMVNSGNTVLSSIPPSDDGFYSELVFAQTREANLRLQTFGKSDVSNSSNYLCEKERDWTCNNGSIMFQEHCYSMVEAPATLAGADNHCQQMGGKVLEIETRMHMNFINSWLVMENFTYEHIWLGYKRKSNGVTDFNYRGYEENSLPFVWTQSGFPPLDFAIDPNIIPSGAECVAMSRADNNLWVGISCFNNSSYICQMPQIAHPDRLRTLFPPNFILPLDVSKGVGDYINKKRPVTENLVAITEEGNSQSNLKGSAHFLGLQTSWLDIDVSGSFETSVTFGLSVSMWVNVDNIQDGERQWLLDASGICSTSSEKDHSFMMFLEKSANVSSAASGNFSLSDPCGDLLIGNGTQGTAVVSGPTLKLVAVLCNGPSDGSSTCKMFTAPESIGLQEGVWNFFGFTYDALNKSGTFIINNTFGYHDTEEGIARTSEYFTFDTKNWLATDAIKGPIRIGSRKFQPPNAASTGHESLAGKISCVQMYEGALSPSQMDHQKSCPVVENHPGKYSHCPFGFQHFRGHCYLLSLREKDFANAEYDCVSRSGFSFNISPTYSASPRQHL
jgi:hypothetical protein